MTAHISAQKGDIAKTVIMPGDPNRAEYIAKKYLKDYKCINKVRGMLGFTGTYKGKNVTVMASGMGMPSMGIYSYELFKFYDVENIIRVGSVGAYAPHLKVYDCILADEVYSDSSFALVQNGYTKNTIYPSINLNEKLKKAANNLNINLNKGRIYSGDVFYKENEDYKKMYDDLGCLGVEMESFALFHNANILNKNAACLLTVSNSFVTGEETTSEEREQSFNQMIEIALESICL